MKYIFGSPLGMTIDQIIDLGNNEHFSKLSCSILPTIDYWKNLHNRIISVIIPGVTDICFEYPVKSIPNAISSYTDVMLISHDTAVAVESKWTENIGMLCKNQKAVRKDEVQLHWIGIISKYINQELTLTQFSDIEYQLLHRVTSACSLGKVGCKVVYQIFYENDHKDDFIIEIDKIQKVLNTEKIVFYVDLVQLDYTASHKTLEKEISLLNKPPDKSARVDLIKSTIKKDILFSFIKEDLILL